MSVLAIHGGDPVISGSFPLYRSMGEAEISAVVRVMRSDRISGFHGSPGPEFLGGPTVREFEAAWSVRYGMKHTVSVNSATSGLIAAMAAIGVSPGDEIIVPPWTMSATIVAPLFYGGIPVFVDIEPDTFCLDPKLVKAAITDKTKAILVVNLFGHPAQLAELRELANENGIFLIEDNAQAPLGLENGKACGTIGDIGIFSLNYHKHIHTGEGGMCVTNNDQLAERLQLIRNHGENVVESLQLQDLTNLIGFNFRMTELSAAIGVEQLAAIDTHVERRENLAIALSEGTRDLDGWTPPAVRANCRHNYYCWTALYDENILGVDRKVFSAALAAEGFPHFVGYLPPLYRLPLFKNRTAIGGQGFPFNLTNQSYQDVLCPVTERLHEKEAILFEPCAYDIDDDAIPLLVEAIRKVHRNRGELHG